MPARFRSAAARALCRPAFILLAAPAPVSLGLEAPAPAACPGEDQLATRANALAGSTIIARDAARHLTVRFTDAPPGYVAELTLREGDVALGRRRLESADADCAVLGEAVALAASILATAPEPPPPPAPSSEPSRDAGPPAGPTPARPEAEARFALLAGLRGSAGDTPGPALTVAAGAERAGRLVRIGLEARVDVPGLGTGDLAGGTASLWRALGVLTACLGPAPFGVCGSVGGGARRASGEGYAADHAVWFPALGAGLSATWDAWHGERIGLRVEAGAWAPLGETRLRTSAGDTWTAWPVAPAVGATLRLP